MGCSYNLICGILLHHFAISLLFLLISSSSHLSPEGRILVQRADIHQTATEDEKATFRAQIGLKVPECERRCTSCAHCEAIQVPTNSQIKNSTTTSGIVYNRGDDNSNNKPLSWKCKCGNLIFNP
ncbi:EPIDERMAL PATTERNING FACTOR-like protein 2 [Olea europaea var. sylvestris]|uniref:EPIDERMAL PATTERNING FACTOR-like protein 2 n=1 Tax=Olea europaea var. sylvestris TaxID=158386 RepID=UPI000C1D87AF|nr:EPIDERMAL PATTERNING FACTOR-like protein 2 [Olea europaea var. sylvestris]